MKQLIWTGLLSMCLGVPAMTAAAQAQQRITPDNWQPVAQPNLEKTLAEARPLEFEMLADGPDSAWVGPEWWVPNPDGKSWSVVLFYYPTYNGPHQVFSHNFATGQTSLKTFHTIEGARFGYHLRPIFFIDHRLVMKAGGSHVSIWVFDPATNELDFKGFPVGDGVVGNGSVAASDDGRQFFGIGQTRGESRVSFFAIDTRTFEGRVVATTPGQDRLSWDYHKIAADGDWAYGAVGNTPWRVYGVNMKTGELRLLAETGPFTGDHRTVRFRQAPSYPGIEVSITGLKGGAQDAVHLFWLRDGQLAPRQGDVPPWTNERLAAARSDFRLPHERRPPDGIERFRMPVDRDGTVRYWYRLNAEQAQIAGLPANQWRKLELDVTLHPQPIRRMVVLPDNTILATTEGYGRAVKFNPATGQRTPLGPTMSIYSKLVHDGKVFMSGYPSTQVWIYDPARPWTVGQADDAPPTAEISADDVTAGPETNPANMGRLMEHTRTHYPLAAAAGRDGRIYFGGLIIRIGNGGGLGWWDTRTRQLGGFYEPFSAYQIFWMCGADHGRYIVISTKPVTDDTNPDYRPERGRLFVFDTATREIIHRVDAGFWNVPGYVTEARPGLVMGYASSAEGGVLYGFDPAAGRVLWTKPAGPNPVTAVSPMRRASYTFALGPDDFIWATMNGTLARIDPRNAEVHPLGRMPDAGIVFHDGDVYVAGQERFRRIKDLPKVHAGSTPAM